MSQHRQVNKLSLQLPFCSVKALNTGHDANPWEMGVFFQSTKLNANLFQKHSQTHPEIVFYQLCCHPLAQSGCHIKLTTTGTLFNIFPLSQQLPLNLSQHISCKFSSHSLKLSQPSFSKLVECFYGTLLLRCLNVVLKKQSEEEWR